MDTRQITTIIIVAVVVILIAWDIVVAVNKKRGDTESEIIRDYTIYPVLPASLGAILGHWTLLGFRVVSDSTLGLALLIAIGSLMVLWSFLAVKKRGPKALRRAHRWVAKKPYIPTIFGYVIGGLLWGMSPSQLTI